MLIEALSRDWWQQRQPWEEERRVAGAEGANSKVGGVVSLEEQQQRAYDSHPLFPQKSAAVALSATIPGFWDGRSRSPRLNNYCLGLLPESASRVLSLLVASVKTARTGTDGRLGCPNRPRTQSRPSLLSSNTSQGSTGFPPGPMQSDFWPAHHCYFRCYLRCCLHR